MITLNILSKKAIVIGVTVMAILFTSLVSKAQYDQPSTGTTTIQDDPVYSPSSPSTATDPSSGYGSNTGSSIYPTMPDNGVGGTYTPGAGGGGSNTGSDPGGGLSNPDADPATWPAPFDSRIIILLVAALIYGAVKIRRSEKKVEGVS